MLRSRVILCAQGIVRDHDTDAVSVFRILEAIKAPKFPVLLQEVNVFSLVERNDDVSDELDVTWRLLFNEEEQACNTTPIQFNGRRRHRMFITINGVKIPGPGVLRIALEYSDLLSVDYSIDVLQDDIEE